MSASVSTVSHKKEVEILFVSWSVKVASNVPWEGFCRYESPHNYSLNLEESTSKDISICFSSNIGETQAWSTKVFVKDGNGKSQHVQRNKVCGAKNVKHEIWKLGKNMLWELLLDGVITFNIFIKDLNVSAYHKVTEIEKCVQTSRQMDDVPCLDCLSLDLCSLLEDDSISDVVLRSGNDKFPVHRAVLSSRSEVFSAMFRSDMKEKREGFVDITDVDPSDLRLLLKYIYGGKVEDLTEELARRLYVVADKYAVHHLKKKCAAFLVEMLTEENACSNLILADTYSDPDFKAFVIDYIIERGEILNTEEWSRTVELHSKAGVEMFKAFLRKQKTVSKDTS